MQPSHALDLTPSFLNDELDTQVLWLPDAPFPRRLPERLRERGLTLRRKTHFERAPVLRVSEVTPANLTQAPADLTGARLVVAWPDAGDADALASALRSAGAEVVVASTTRTSLVRARQLDADAVLISPQDFFGAGWSTIEAFWDDPQLRWLPVLLTPQERLVDATLLSPDVGDVAAAVHDLRRDSQKLIRQLASARELEIPLDWMGPVRTLRALARSGRQLRVAFRTADMVLELDVAQRRVHGARGRLREQGEPTLFGMRAFATLVGLEHGRVLVRATPQVELTDVDMEPDRALELVGSDPRLSAPVRTGRRRKVGLPPVQPTSSHVVPIAHAETMRMPAVESRWQSLRTWSTRPVQALTQWRSVLALGPGFAGGLRTSARLGLSVLAGLLFGTAFALLWGQVGPQEREVAPISVGHVASGEAARAAAGPDAPRVAAPHVQQLPPPAGHKVEQLESLPPVKSRKLVAEPTEIGVQPQEPASKPATKGAPAKKRVSPRTRRANRFANRGLAQRKAGRLRAAKASYRRALTARPGLPRALAGLTHVHLRLGHGQNALRTARALVRKNPNVPSYQLLLGDAYRRTGNKAAARSAYRRAAKLGSPYASKRLKNVR